jgi:hypothetical protein
MKLCEKRATHGYSQQENKADSRLAKHPGKYMPSLVNLLIFGDISVDIYVFLLYWQSLVIAAVVIIASTYAVGKDSTCIQVCCSFELNWLLHVR